MSSKKSDLDNTDQLLSDLSLPEDVPFSSLPSYKLLPGSTGSPIMDFIEYFKISTGNTRVRASMLFKLFYGYSRLPISRREFTTEFNLYIPPYPGEIYKLNIDPIQLGKVLIQLNAENSRENHRMMVPTFDAFLEKTGITGGDIPVCASSLFLVYKKVSNNLSTRISYNQFFTLCKVIFPFYHGKSKSKANRKQNLYLCLNDKIYNYLPKEEILNARGQQRKIWGDVGLNKKKRRYRKTTKVKPSSP